MKFRLTAACLTAGALFVAAVPASATVVFDADKQTGFVGKGDVQLAFEWNNKQLQANAADGTFRYSATDVYKAVCIFTTGEGRNGEQVHNPTRTRTVGVGGDIA